MMTNSLCFAFFNRRIWANVCCLRDVTARRMCTALQVVQHKRNPQVRPGAVQGGICVQFRHEDMRP